MPKRSIQAFKPKGLRLDHQFYSDSDIEAIISAAGRLPHHTTIRVPWRRALSERLERAAYNYTVFSEFETEPTAMQIANAMANIEAAAAKLIVALHLPEAMDEDPIAPMPTALRYGALQAMAALEAEQLEQSGEVLLRDSVHGVYRLQRGARDVQARRKTVRQTPRAERHAGDKDLDRLFGDLAGIWIDIFERPPGTSVSGPMSSEPGKAGGPFIRFLDACLRPILKDNTPTRDQLRERVRRLFGDKIHGRIKSKK